VDVTAGEAITARCRKSRRTVPAGQHDGDSVGGGMTSINVCRGLGVAAGKFFRDVQEVTSPSADNGNERGASHFQDNGSRTCAARLSRARPPSRADNPDEAFCRSADELCYTPAAVQAFLSQCPGCRTRPSLPEVPGEAAQATTRRAG
jgi:hypothetical protein